VPFSQSLNSPCSANGRCWITIKEHLQRMGEREQESPNREEPKLPTWIRLWFVVDAVIAMAPPVYWFFAEPAEFVTGIPNALIYFLLVGTIICASIIAAYIAEARATGHVL
jgi:hypothetical protein